MKSQETLFLSLLDDHVGMINKLSRMYTNSEEDQQDLVQEIIYQVWRSFSQFRGESKIGTWIYRVGLNTALLHVQKQKKRVDTVEIKDQMHVSEKGNTNLEQEQFDAFYREVKKLSKMERAVIFLFMEGQSHQEIGENLGITEANARVRLHRIKNKLKSNLKGETHGS
ncbi:MAG: RNA polymerase sigma factor [Bacteroidia bacterium]|nr:RNA polymerase sigma factor [Bacteroidia bacterium]